MPETVRRLLSSRFFWVAVAILVLLSIVQFLVFGSTGTSDSGIDSTPITPGP
jgi:hypothetical protein